MIISRTPVRISFFGGGTDYPAYYLRHPGAVLGTTINQYTYLSINTLSDFFEHKIRIGYSKTELVKTLEEIEHPSIRECLRFKEIFGNLDIHIFSDLPAKTGLGSSSSFTVGFLNALYALRGQKISKQKLAEEACFVEQHLIKENVGSQDQFHSAFGGLNIIEFFQKNISIRPVIISLEKQEYFEKHLMIFYTGLTRFASNVVKEQIEKTQEKSNDEYLKKMYEMVFHAEEIIVNSSKEEMIQKLGKLLDDGWNLKKKLSSKITNPQIDEAYEKAKELGAIGGKLCGAGSGGFLALLVPLHLQDLLRKNMGLLEVKFRFESQGSTIIYMKD
ncbi:MAG: kinase [Chlamydiae bacterium]|nr:kinase [Chlamydiota bacterium]